MYIFNQRRTVVYNTEKMATIYAENEVVYAESGDGSLNELGYYKDDVISTRVFQKLCDALADGKIAFYMPGKEGN